MLDLIQLLLRDMLTILGPQIQGLSAYIVYNVQVSTYTSSEGMEICIKYAYVHLIWERAR